jgi:single-strand DNA-binding protein
MINSVTLIGHLGKDPEIRTTEGGASVVSFPLAFHEFRQVKGEKQTITHWFNCFAFGSLAEICSEYMHKGAKVGIMGQLRQKTWESKEGQKRNSVEIQVREVDFLNGNEKSESAKEE